MVVSIERFLTGLSASGIMSTADVETCAAGIAPTKRSEDAEAFARELVRQGKVTRFQAAAIYQDKADGLLLGNYLILDKLGAGGMGHVFRARHRRMDRVVALKVLPKKSLDSPEAVARFQREVKAAARLTHPNIVTAHDADEAGGMHFLVMEYIEGSDLSGLVKQGGPLSVKQAVDYVLQAARGLAHAHASGVIHRDIKPSNLLVDSSGTVKVLDMGLARVSDPLADPAAAPGADLTHSGNIMGTVDYMAPEQAMDSRQADARSDIYSLGCTLHYLLTGRPPYGGDTVLKRLTAHQQAAIPLLTSLRPDVPTGLNEIFGRMLAKRPATRYQTANELAAAFQSLRDRSAVTQPVPVTVPSSTAWAVPDTPFSNGLRELESIMLPGVASTPRKSRNSGSIAPLIAAAAIVLLLITAGASVWLMSGRELGETAQATFVEPQRDNPGTNAEPPKLSPQAEAASTEVPPPAGGKMAMPSKVELPSEAISPAIAADSLAAIKAPSTTSAPSSPPAQMPLVSAPATPVTPPAPIPVAPTPSKKDVVQVAAVEPSPASADAKLPIPNNDAQSESLKLIKELYQDDYVQAKQPDAKATLAEKLLNESEQAKDSPKNNFRI